LRGLARVPNRMRQTQQTAARAAHKPVLIGELSKKVKRIVSK
jgi:hypothetical protein